MGGISVPSTRPAPLLPPPLGFALLIPPVSSGVNVKGDQPFAPVVDHFLSPFALVSNSKRYPRHRSATFGDMTATTTQQRSALDLPQPVASLPGDLDTSAWYKDREPAILTDLGFHAIDQSNGSGSTLQGSTGSSKFRKARGSDRNHASATRIDPSKQSNMAKLLTSVNETKKHAKQPGTGSEPRNAGSFHSMQKHGAVVANKLALRYHTLAQFQEKSAPGLSGRYNPLQTIRDRRLSHYTPESGFLWGVSQNELNYDLTWRQNMHVAQAQGASSVALSTLTASDVSSALGSGPQRPEGLSSSKLLSPNSGYRSGPSYDRLPRNKSNVSVLTQATNMSIYTDKSDTLVQSSVARSSSSGHFPLIDRLKSKYDSGGRSDSSSDAERETQRRPAISRNQSQIISLGKMNQVTSDSQLIDSRRSSAASSSSHGISRRGVATGSLGLAPPPMLTITAPTESIDKSIDKGVKPSSDDSTSPATPDSAKSNDGEAAANLENFLSLTNCGFGGKRCPESMTRHELEYMSAVFEAALRKKRLNPTMRDMPCRGLVCGSYKESLKSELVPKYLDYLQCMEKCALSRQREIESHLGRPIDTLRVDADRLISEVNTTLNRKLRETVARLDKTETACRTACLYSYGYTILEWAVIILLRLIWVVVGTFKTIKWLLFTLFAAMSYLLA